MTAPCVPVTLEGSVIRLEPLEPRHVEGLCRVGLDPELWTWSPTRVDSPAAMTAYLDNALALLHNGSAIPFATILQETGMPVGSTRFGNIDRENGRVEIGWTWVGRPWQRTAVNTEAKYLMLRHAFEQWGVARVEFKTDLLNETSRRALLRLGAKEEGVLRKHMKTTGGRIRDSVYFSILDDEWPEVKRALEQRLGMR
jgi:RimJ/RimL family protein N-acetyltransferase